ncbi:gluconokinase [Parafrigoribacterium soli]|uniref:gluconokinase n=1 Tax=Parafrigoribacterium soli TaxID=3144663 RepID=UPI0032EE333A
MSTPQQPLIVIMGVAGSGKSTVGAMLAERLGVAYVDADDLHPKANVEKMASGHPLNDDDRWPWLAKVGETLQDADGTGLVVACSALKHSYRLAILEKAPRTRFVDLSGPRDLLQERLRGRKGHYMPPALLDSQIETLEPLGPEEPGFTVQIDQAPEQIVDEIQATLG